MLWVWLVSVIMRVTTLGLLINCSLNNSTVGHIPDCRILGCCCTLSCRNSIASHTPDCHILGCYILDCHIPDYSWRTGRWFATVTASRKTCL